MRKEKKEKKTYYSPVKECDSFKRPHFFFGIIKGLVRAFFPKNEFIWKTEKPADGDPVIFICNHTKIYAPTYFIACHKEKVRVWANCYFLFTKLCWHHMKTKVINNRKPQFLLKPIAFLITPLIVLTFRAFNPIPVFHTGREVFDMTFKKSMDTLNEGIPQVIFPERTENKVNRYIYQLNTGFPRVAELYYRETGRKVKFYPVYCAEKLHTFAVGDPIEYDPSVPMAKQKITICKYLEDKICELGDSLPEHEPVIYG
ncbi:MAG: hypothetical protein ACI4M8_00310 [Christensenellales bacterium]